MDAIANENFSGTKSEFKRGFTKVVVTRAGRLWATLVPWRAATQYVMTPFLCIPWLADDCTLFQASYGLMLSVFVDLNEQISNKNKKEKQTNNDKR